LATLSVKRKLQVWLIGWIAACGLFLAGCNPNSMAYIPPISDGTVVLLRQGNTYGAFILTAQSSSPEVTDYSWYLRSDGKSTFDPKDPAVSSGKVRGARDIRFGPFVTEWSTAGPSNGYVYYPERRTFLLGRYVIRTPGSYSMAVTDQHSIEGLDASDKKWVFRKLPKK
jgi:hypothetical protein